MYLCICLYVVTNLHVYSHIFTYIAYIYVYIYLHIYIMQENTLENHFHYEIQNQLSRGVKRDETAKCMVILGLYTFSLSSGVFRNDKHGLLFFKMLRLCSLPLTSTAREEEECEGQR